MTIRNPIPNGTGLSVRTALNLRTKSLFDAAQFPLTAIGGTANAVTASLAPALDGDGLLDGMTFTLTWGAANTGGVTLAINGGSPVPVLGPNGLALPAASVGDGLRSQITYIGGDFVMLSPTLLSGGVGGVRYSFTFTASGTWTKPTDLPDATPVTIQLWAGGGGGSSTGGGGGGGFATRIIRAEDLGATVTVTIGAGGAANAVGGNSTFGAALTAYGGGAAGSAVGGGGGGEVTAGAGTAGGLVGGGTGGANGQAGFPAGTIFGGGGGKGQGTNAGGAAVYGGGGGGSSGGLSAYGGNGGLGSAAGTAPAGGGGQSGTGARGECRVWI